MRYGTFSCLLLQQSDSGLHKKLLVTSGLYTVMVVCFIVIWNNDCVCLESVEEMKKQKVETAGLILNDVTSRFCKATVAVERAVVGPLCGP